MSDVETFLELNWKSNVETFLELNSQMLKHFQN